MANRYSGRRIANQQDWRDDMFVPAVYFDNVIETLRKVDECLSHQDFMQVRRIVRSVLTANSGGTEP